ncbi:MAG: hypothetical protein HQ483_04585 [Rhodospirillales bacterium]|nr:hypothetical protein [Rhodospirillales bacterium]
MPDRFGPRGVCAVIIPQQNANMQPEYELMRPPGINNQAYRFDISVHDRVPEAVLKTMPQVHGCYPDMIIVGNSFEMRTISPADYVAYHQQLESLANGVPFSTAADGCLAALRTLGAKRIAVLSPMSEGYSKNVQQFYENHGFEAPCATWLGVKESKDIFKVTVEQIIAAFDTPGFQDVDTILHVGSALGIVGMLNELETRLGRPIVSSNAAAYWYALRQFGIRDTRADIGKLWTLDSVV